MVLHKVFIQKLRQLSAVTCILSAVLIFHLVFNLWFLSIDQTAPYDTAGNNYIRALENAKALSGVSLLEKAAILYFRTPDDTGPAFMMPLTLSLVAFGSDHAISTLVNTGFLAVLIVSLYALGKTMFDGTTGLLAAVFVSFYPIIFSLSRGSVSRLSLVAMVTLSLWALVKTRGFTSRRNSAIFGVCIAFASMTKPEFSLPLVVPFLAELVPVGTKLIKEKDSGGLRRLSLNLMVAGFIILLLAGPWYLAMISRYENTPSAIQAIARLPAEGYRPLPLLRSFWMVGSDLFGNLVQWLFVISLLVFLLKGSRRIFVLGWILLPSVAFFYFSGRSATCFTQGADFSPIFPGIALVTAFAVGRLSLAPLSNRKTAMRTIGPIILALIIGAHLALYLGVNTANNGGLPLLRGAGFVNWARFGCSTPEPCYGEGDTLCVAANPLNNRVPDGFAFVTDELKEALWAANPSRQQRVLLFYRQGPLTSAIQHTLVERDILQGRQRTIELSCLLTYDPPPMGTELKTPESCVNDIASADLIVLERDPSAGRRCKENPPYEKILTAATKALQPLGSEFDLVFTLRAQSPQKDSSALPPHSVIFVKNQSNSDLTWQERGISAPSEELIGMVLTRTGTGVEVSDEEIRFLDQWLTRGCEADMSIAAP